MTALREIKLQLFGFALWPASLGALEEGRTVRDPAWSIPFPLLRKSVDVLLVRRIGGNLLKNQTTDRHLLSVGHRVSVPRVEDYSTRSAFDDVQILFAGSANEDR